MPVQSLIKQPSESRLFSMEFVRLMDAGEEITSVQSVAASPDGLTLSGSPTFSGTRASQRIDGGTDGVRYKITVVVNTSAGNRLEGEGFLQVKDL